MKRKTTYTILGTVASVSAVVALAVTIPSANSATIPKLHHPITVITPCATYDVTGHPTTGMPWDEPVTFCGAGIKPGTWICPAKSPALNPGTLLHCTKVTDNHAIDNE